jgi:hypothetical protein
MGFNKKYLPPIDKMKEARETYESDLDFLENYIGKYDCLLGSRESIDYLMELEENQEKCHI